MSDRKGAEIGTHILSGAVMDPKALSELIPDWQARNAPLDTPVEEDRFVILSETGAIGVPEFMLPAALSITALHREPGPRLPLARRRGRGLGSRCLSGLCAASVLYDDMERVSGIITGDMGRRARWAAHRLVSAGYGVACKYTLFAEGCRGHLGKELQERFDLRNGVDPQVYGIGIKELWEVKPEQHKKGLVMHTAGWPLDPATYGGSFCYHYGENLVAIGMVIGAGYENPYLSPFEEMQRLKTHPRFKEMLAGGKRLAYGARAIAAGGCSRCPN
jgi:electron-transferring-flavoprotein dehydrogenase